MDGDVTMEATEEDEAEEIARAIALSMQEDNGPSSSDPTRVSDMMQQIPGAPPSKETKRKLNEDK